MTLNLRPFLFIILLFLTANSVLAGKNNKKTKNNSNFDTTSYKKDLKNLYLESEQLEKELLEKGYTSDNHGNYLNLISDFSKKRRELLLGVIEKYVKKVPLIIDDKKIDPSKHIAIILLGSDAIHFATQKSDLEFVVLSSQTVIHGNTFKWLSDLTQILLDIGFALDKSMVPRILKKEKSMTNIGSAFCFGGMFDIYPLIIFQRDKKFNNFKKIQALFKNALKERLLIINDTRKYFDDDNPKPKSERINNLLITSDPVGELIENIFGNLLNGKLLYGDNQLLTTLTEKYEELMLKSLECSFDLNEQKISFRDYYLSYLSNKYIKYYKNKINNKLNISDAKAQIYRPFQLIQQRLSLLSKLGDIDINSIKKDLESVSSFVAFSRISEGRKESLEGLQEPFDQLSEIFARFHSTLQGEIPEDYRKKELDFNEIDIGNNEELITYLEFHINSAKECIEKSLENDGSNKSWIKSALSHLSNILDFENTYKEKTKKDVPDILHKEFIKNRDNAIELLKKIK